MGHYLIISKSTDPCFFPLFPSLYQMSRKFDPCTHTTIKSPDGFVPYIDRFKTNVKLSKTNADFSQRHESKQSLAFNQFDFL